MAQSAEVSITPFTVDYVPDVFSLIDANRAHLSQFYDITAQKYPTVQAVFDSVAKPSVIIPVIERFVILAGQTPVGNINVTPHNQYTDTYNIGYWVGNQHVGHGYAGLAVGCLETVLRDRQPPAQRLTADTYPDNRASQHVQKGAGFIAVRWTDSATYYKKYLT